MEALIFIALVVTWISLRSVRNRQSELERRIDIIERNRAAERRDEAEPVTAIVPPMYVPPVAAAASVIPASVIPEVREEAVVEPEPVIEPVVVQEAPQEPAAPQYVHYVQEEVPASYYDAIKAAERETEEALAGVTAATASKPVDTTSLEQRIGSRWLVWLGGLSLILGGAYFVAYSIEQGWLSIGLRLTLSGLFGLGLMVVGEKLRRNPRFKDADGKIVSTPQAASAGGAGILFASIYSAYGLFGLISQPVAFVALAAVSLLTLFTSLRQGVIMAVIGLVGAYSVPAILGVHGNIPLLIAYLLALSVLAEVLEHRRGWKVLHPIALGANLLWCFVPLITATGDVQYWAMTYLLALGALYSTKLRGRALSVGLLLALVVQKLSLMVPFGAAAQLVTVAAFALPLVASYKRKDNIGPMLSGLFALAVTAVCFGPGVLNMSINTLLPLSFAAILLVAATRRSENADNEIQFVALLPLAIMVAFWGKMSGFARSDEWSLLFIGFAALNGLLHAYSIRRVSAELPVPSILIANVTAALLMAAVAHYEGAALATVLALYVPVAAWLCRRSAMLVNLLALVAGYAILRTLMLEGILTHPINQPGGLSWIILSFGVPLIAYIGASWLLRGRAAFANTRSVVELGALLHAVLLPYALVRWSQGSDSLVAWPLSFSEASLLGTLWLLLAVGGMRIETIRQSIIGKAGCYALAIGATLSLVFGPLLAFNPLFGDQPARFFTLLLAYGVPAALYIGAIRPLIRLGRLEVAQVAGAIGFVFAMMLSLLEVLYFTRGETLIGDLTLVESTVLGLLWSVVGCALAIYPAIGEHPIGRWMARATAIIGFATLAIFNLLLLNPLFTNASVGALPVFNWLLPAYGIPMLLLAVGARELLRRNMHSQAHTAALGALLFGMVFSALEVLHFMRGDGFYGSFSFHEATLIGLIWAAVGGLAGTHERVASSEIARQAFALLTTAGLFVLTTFSLVVFNPLWSGALVGTLPVFNWLLLAYGLPTLLLGFVVRDQAKRGKAKHILATGSAVLTLIYLFTWLSLEVRHAFHGSVLTGTITQAEWYSYSAVWLLGGFALLAVGVWRRAKMLRQAALAVILLTVAKVFFSDMGALEGLLRAASFLGLGVALMGVGYLYQRFVLGEVDDTNKA